ncbi:MAG: class I SAM-dependent methyltransferase [Bdellovibrionota bacterium]
MIAFNPSDPFPLLEELDHAAAKRHAKEADVFFGLRAEAVEAEILATQKPEADQELWVGLPLQSLQTPYLELRQILSRLAPAPGATLVDLGAAYGRMALVMARHFPEVRFVGYERVGARVREGVRWLKANGIAAPGLFEADLSAPGFSPEAADFYFLYDYGSASAIRKTLSDLRGLAQARPITVVARGRRSRDLIEHEEPWLTEIVPPRHFTNYSIFQSRTQ